MAKCKAESIRNEVMNGLVKDRSDLKDTKVKLQRIGEIVFKLAKAELMSKVQDNKIDKALAERLDTLRMSKIEKTAGTIEKETIKNDAPKTKMNSFNSNEHTLNIGGLSISYESVPAGSISSLASTNARTGRIRIQEGLTAVKVAEYLQNNEEVEGSSEKTKSKTRETRGIVVGLLNRKYGINIMEVLSAMQGNDQLLRSFLLLHEYRHTLQLEKSGSKEAFMEAYNEDPVKFELDADLFALKALKSEIGLIKDMTKEDFRLTKAGYTVEKSTKEGPKPKETKNNINSGQTSSSVDGETTTNDTPDEDKFVVHDNITELKDNQIFVFGANAEGIHGKGSALQARKFGTANGEAVNSLSANGKTWGIVTKDSPYGSKVSKDTLINNINKLFKYASMPENANKEFLFTAIGTGLAGFTNEEVLEAIGAVTKYKNIKFPSQWKSISNNSVKQYEDQIGDNEGSTHKEKGSSKQKDDTMSSNIVDRTTNNITKEALECANGM